MKSRIACFVTIVALGVVSMLLDSPGLAAETEKMLAHDVYFSLNDNSPQAKVSIAAGKGARFTGPGGRGGGCAMGRRMQRGRVGLAVG